MIMHGVLDVRGGRALLCLCLRNAEWMSRQQESAIHVANAHATKTFRRPSNRDGAIKGNGVRASASNQFQAFD